jgi:hypothetical protein
MFRMAMDKGRQKIAQQALKKDITNAVNCEDTFYDLRIGFL